MNTMEETKNVTAVESPNAKKHEREKYANGCGHSSSAQNEFGVCTACVAEGKGAKADDGKVQWVFLLDLTDAIEEITHVLVFGGKKYSRGNWRNVADARDRYTNALLRHVLAWYNGERNDDGPGGSKRHHLAAAGCCLLFLLAMDLRGLFQKAA